MRISESRLRKIIREAINEMAFMGIEPMRDLIDKPVKSKKDDERRELINKVFSSPNFIKKLKNFLSSWSTNFYVAPMHGSFFYSEGGRVEILPFDQFLKKHGDKNSLNDALNYYAQIANPNMDCLIIPVAYNTSRGRGLTPWMIFHAMFDDLEMAAYDYFPKATKIRILAKTLIRDLQDDLFKMIRRLGGSLEEKNKILEQFNSLLEEVFTFGSTRMNYFTKLSDVINDRSPETVFNDLPNEVAVQSLTKNGFRFNTEPLERISEISPEFNYNYYKNQFDKISSMSSEAKSEADSFLKGKVIIVDVS